MTRREADLTEEEQAYILARVGVFADANGKYFYGGTVDDEGNAIGDAQSVSPKEASDLTQSVLDLEKQASQVFEGDICALLKKGGLSRDDEGNYRDKHSQLIPPRDLIIRLAEQQRVHLVLDLGAHHLANNKAIENLPVLDPDREGDLDRHGREMGALKDSVSAVATRMAAAALTGRALKQGQMPVRPDESAVPPLELGLSVNINAGACDKSSLPERLLVEQDSKDCKTVAQLGVMSSPEAPMGFGVRIPLGWER